ncbi:hypothetical protein WJX73_002912 [Symbiochloris irregularis]|uniref:Uncharacterized protein n=1 Tax=Symbiochloris irregularis TaxID=706552 RepID=A0AAW1Q0E4_9CHLO
MHRVLGGRRRRQQDCRFICARAELPGGLCFYQRLFRQQLQRRWGTGRKLSTGMQERRTQPAFNPEKSVSMIDRQNSAMLSWQCCHLSDQTKRQKHLIEFDGLCFCK